MNEYIKKSTVLKEINRRLKKYASLPEDDKLDAIYGGKCTELVSLFGYIDNLKGEEMDLENSIKERTEKSKDEGIRKELIEFLVGKRIIGNDLEGVNIDKTLIWLEKQGQVKESTEIQHDNKTCKENDDSLTSEDERIGKDIVSFLRSKNGYMTPNEDWDFHQHTTWSKEDEQIALSIEQVMNCAALLNIVPEKISKIRTWLQSLKQRVRSCH